MLDLILDFVDEEIERHPERLCVVDTAFAERLRALTEGVEVDLDAPLPDEEAR